MTEIQVLADAAHELLGRDVIFQVARVEQAQLQLPHHAVRPSAR